MYKIPLTKRFIFTGMCVALCAVLPIAFHPLQNAGNVFCPMHIPVLLCGLICGWPFGLLCGLAGPFISGMTTGMPEMAYLPVMTVELAGYGAVAGIMMRLVHTKRIYADLYVSLAAALLAGRVIAGVSMAAVFSPGSYSMAAWAAGYFAVCLPGIAIQLILLPGVVLALERARLIPERYHAEAL